jgi:hypothetical protein
MKGNPPLDNIRIDGTIQTDFILGELSPFQVLNTGVFDPVVQKEGSLIFGMSTAQTAYFTCRLSLFFIATPKFNGKIITPTWGVSDFAVEGERQFDGSFWSRVHFPHPYYMEPNNTSFVFRRL